MANRKKQAKPKEPKFDVEIGAEEVVDEAPRYKMVPVDELTHQRIMVLCNAYGFGKRGQGALVRKLVNSEYAKLPEADS